MVSLPGPGELPLPSVSADALGGCAYSQTSPSSLGAEPLSLLLPRAHALPEDPLKVG